MNNRYSILIQWSDADKLYLVTIPEFAGFVMQPCTGGETYEIALANAQDCIAACLEHWSTSGVTPPTPMNLQVA
jgi:predicted RNase H-like HicB family nuclease